MTDGSDCSSTPVLSAGVMTSSTVNEDDYSTDFSGVSTSGYVFNGQYYKGNFLVEGYPI